MPGQRVLLELTQHVPAEHVGQEDVERDCARLILLGEIERIVAALGQQGLEAFVARQVDKDTRIMRVVLDDKQDVVARIQIHPVVRDRFDRALGCDVQPGKLLRHRRRSRRRMRRHGRTDIFDRQIKREGRPLTRRAVQVNFAAEQARQFAADGKAEAGTAIFAAGRGVRLLEGFENDLLFLQRNANAGVGDFESHHRRCLVENRMVRAPTAEHSIDVEPDAALRRKFERVRQQVLEHLLQALCIRSDGAPKSRIDVNVER